MNRPLKILLVVMAFAGIGEAAQAQTAGASSDQRALSPLPQAQAASLARTEVLTPRPFADVFTLAFVADSRMVNASMASWVAGDRTSDGEMQIRDRVSASFAGPGAPGVGAANSAVNTIPARGSLSAPVSGMAANGQRGHGLLPVATMPEPTDGTMLLCGLAIVA